MRRKNQNGGKSSAATTRAPKQGRPTQAIIESNRKTELCRNWQKGVCTYGGRCAFAHGSKELKYGTLREMENAGRIPDASKYRCYPCMTWVATGSCPYASRCVFIHDVRVKGPVDASLYAGCLAKSPTACPFSDRLFFFPDIARDPDSTELPTHPAQYDLEPRKQGTGETSSRAVYNLWYSFVSTLIEEESTAENKTPPASTSSSTSTTTRTPQLGPSSTLEDTAATKRSKSYAAAAAAALAASKGSTAGRRQASKISQANSKLEAMAADLGSPGDATHHSGPTTTTTKATTTNNAKTATSNSSATSGTGSEQSLRQRRLVQENRRPRESVRHLPVFEALSKGISTCPTKPLPAVTEQAGDGPPSVPLAEESGSSWRDESGSEALLSFGSYPSSCAGSPHSLGTESFASSSSELRPHTYSREHLRPLQPGTLPPTSVSFQRVDSWKSDSAGNPSDIGGQPGTDDAITIQDSGGGSVVMEHPAPSSDSVATAAVRSGHAVVHHRQQACAGKDPIGGIADAAVRKRWSIHAVPSV